MGELCRIVRHLESGIVSDCHRTRPLERSESLIRCLDRWANACERLRKFA
jgi:hypothetical protein